MEPFAFEADFERYLDGLKGMPVSQVDLKHEIHFHNFINSVLGDEEPLVKVEEALAVQEDRGWHLQVV